MGPVSRQSATVICAWCSRSWDVEALRQDGWELLSDRQAVVLDILRQFAHARSGDTQFQHEVSHRVYGLYAANLGRRVLIRVGE